MRVRVDFTVLGMLNAKHSVFEVLFRFSCNLYSIFLLMVNDMQEEGGFHE